MAPSITKDQKKSWSIRNLPHNQPCCHNLSQKHAESLIENLESSNLSTCQKEFTFFTAPLWGKVELYHKYQWPTSSTTRCVLGTWVAGSLRTTQELPGTAASFWNDVVSSEKLELSFRHNTMAQVRIVQLWECTRFGRLSKQNMQKLSVLLPFETSLQDMKKSNGFSKPCHPLGSWEILLLLRHFFLKFSAQLWTKGFHPKWTGSK